MGVRQHHVCLIDRGQTDSVAGVSDRPCVQTDRSMLPFNSGAKESRGARGVGWGGQLTVTDFSLTDDFQECVLYGRVQVGVNVQLIQVITIHTEAVTTQIAS